MKRKNLVETKNYNSLKGSGVGFGGGGGGGVVGV